MHAVRPKNDVGSRQVSGAELGVNLRGRQPTGFRVPQWLTLGTIFRHDFLYRVDQLQSRLWWTRSQVKVIADDIDVRAGLA